MEDYKKKLEIAKKRYNNLKISDEEKEFIEFIFPELKRSEDNKIILSLMSFLNSLSETEVPSKEEFKKWWSYLEKLEKRESDIRYKYLDELIEADDIYQMSMNDEMVNEAKTKALNALSDLNISNILFEEQSHLDNTSEELDKKPNSNPKFKIGNWIVYEGLGTYKVIEIHEGWYSVVDSNDRRWSVMFEKESLCHIWTIEDAKEGDVIVTPNNNIVIYKCKGKGSQIWCSYGLYYNTLVSELNSPNGAFNSCCGYMPATKEQCDLLFQKMKEAGCELDLKKQNKTNTEEALDEAINLYYYSYGNGKGSFDNLSFEKFKDIVKMFVEDYGKESHFWDEKDEKTLDEVILDLKLLKNKDTGEEGKAAYQREIDWLESLKPENRLKSSEDKNETVNKCPNYSEGYGCSTSPSKQCNTCPDYKLYNHWKPSEEQMKALNWIAYNYALMDKGTEEKLQSLYNDLKKL